MANRVVLGAFDNTYVLRISKPGFNVLDPNLSAGQLVFDSRWSEYTSVHSEGIASFAPGQSTVAVAHDLGFRPFAMCWYMSSLNQMTAFDTNKFFIECHAFTDRIEIYSPPVWGSRAEEYPRDYQFYVKYAIMRTRING